MIIKSFIGSSAASALKQVREEMGRDAVVLKTREVTDGGVRRVEVTACLDRSTAERASRILTAGTRIESAGAERVAAAGGRNAAESESRIELGVLTAIQERIAAIDTKLERLLTVDSLGRQASGCRREEIYSLLLRMKDADVPEAYAETLLSSVLERRADIERLSGVLLAAFTDALSSMIIGDLKFKPGDKVLIIGPVASGKTSVMGKLAARSVQRFKHKVRLVSLDALKIGAYDEIHNYGELLGVEVSDPFQGDFRTDSDADKIVFIDTPALPRDPDKLQALQKQVREVDPSHCLATFSSLTRSGDIATFVDEIRPLGPSHLVMTMLDVTARYGSIVAAGVASGLKLTFVTDAPGGVGTIKSPDPSHLAKAILRPEPADE